MYVHQIIFEIKSRACLAADMTNGLIVFPTLYLPLNKSPSQFILSNVVKYWEDFSSFARVNLSPINYQYLVAMIAFG